MKFYVIYFMCAIGAFIGVEKATPEVPFVQKVSVSAGFPISITALVFISLVKESRK